MSLIEGDIWAAVPSAKCIQVIDEEGNIKREISCKYKPYSVKKAPWGDITVASNRGLHIVCPDGTVQSTICGDAFYDVCSLERKLLL